MSLVLEMHYLFWTMKVFSLLYSVLDEAYPPAVVNILLATLRGFPSNFCHRKSKHDTGEACKTSGLINSASPAGPAARPLGCTNAVTWVGGWCIWIKLVVRVIFCCSSLCMNWDTPKVLSSFCFHRNDLVLPSYSLFSCGGILVEFGSLDAFGLKSARDYLRLSVHLEGSTVKIPSGLLQAFFVPTVTACTLVFYTMLQYAVDIWLQDKTKR